MLNLIDSLSKHISEYEYELIINGNESVRLGSIFENIQSSRRDIKKHITKSINSYNDEETRYIAYIMLKNTRSFSSFLSINRNQSKCISFLKSWMYYYLIKRDIKCSRKFFSTSLFDDPQYLLACRDFIYATKDAYIKQILKRAESYTINQKEYDVILDQKSSNNVEWTNIMIGINRICNIFYPNESNVNLIYLKSENTEIRPYCIKLSPSKIYIAVEEKHGLKQYLDCLHELGHYLYYKSFKDEDIESFR